MKDMAPDSRALAEGVAASLALVARRFAAMPDVPGAQVHVLFAQLYRCTTLSWLSALEEAEAPDLAYRTIVHFYTAYEEGVLACRTLPLAQVPRPWRKYHWLARRLTMRAPMTLLVLLVSLAARAHVRHDLGPAIRAAEADCLACEGGARDGSVLYGPRSDRTFMEAARTFVSLFEDHPSRWRRFWLAQCDRGLLALGPVWLGTFQGWRRASHDDAHPESY
jgi:hypothetical protein